MISWIQNTFQHHFRTVFLVLLGVVIISFVFVINASTGVGHADRESIRRDFFGLNLASQADVQRLQGDAALSIELQYGFAAGGDRLQRYAFARQASLYLANQLHVPPATDAEISNAIKAMRMFAGENGQFDQKRYDDFRRNMQKAGPGARLSESDIVRVISDNVRVERVQKLLAGPGFALPADVKRELAAADTSWTLAIAKLDRASYAPTLNPPDSELQKYFEDNSFRYQIPRRVVVDLVEFPSSMFASQVKFTDEDLKSWYDLNTARFTPAPGADGKPAAAPEFNAVRPQVLQAYVAERAARLAAEAADQLSLELFNAKLAPGNPNFDLALSRHQVAARSLPPFAENQPPAEIGGDPRIASAAVKLSSDTPISDAFQTSKGSLLLCYRDALAPTQPTFVEVRKQVLADYAENERTKRFVSAGALVRGATQAKIKAGASFETAVVEAAREQGIKADVIKPAAFTLRQPPKDVEPSIYQILLNLKKGEVSEMVSTAERGFLVCALDQKVPDLSEINPSYASTRERITGNVAMTNTGEYLEDMIAREEKRGQKPAR